MPRGLIPEAFVQQSELVVWSDDMNSKYKHDGCAICHENFSPALPDICRVLDCSHVFHAKCVDLWFIKATFCPLCKSDLKLTFRNTSSQRSLGRFSHTSSQISLGDRSHSSSVRSGQILVGHSNSDPALLRILQENPQSMGLMGARTSPPLTPDRQYGSATSLAISFSDRSLPVMGYSRSENSIGLLSSSSSGVLPAVQELSDEARFGEASSLPSSQRSHSPGLASHIAELRPPMLEGSGNWVNALQPTPESPAEEAGSPQDAQSERQSGGSSSSSTTAATTAEQRQMLSVPRNNSWLNSRSNVGLLPRKGTGSPQPPAPAAAAGTPPLQPGSIAAVPRRAAVDRNAAGRQPGRMAIPTGNSRGPVVIPPSSDTLSSGRRSSSVPAQESGDKVADQTDKLSASFPNAGPAGSATPPSSSVASSSATTPPTAVTVVCQPIIKGNTTAKAASAVPASSTSHLQGLATPSSIGVAPATRSHAIEGLATPPSIGIATSSQAATQAQRRPYFCFAGSVTHGNAGALIPTAPLAYPGLLGPAPSNALLRPPR